MSCTICPIAMVLSDHTNTGDSCYYFNLHSMVLVGTGACSPKVQVKCNGNCNNNNYSQLHITVTLDCCCGLLPQRTRLQITLVRVFGPHPALYFASRSHCLRSVGCPVTHSFSRRLQLLWTLDHRYNRSTRAVESWSGR